MDRAVLPTDSRAQHCLLWYLPGLRNGATERQPDPRSGPADPRGNLHTRVQLVRTASSRPVRYPHRRNGPRDELFLATKTEARCESSRGDYLFKGGGFHDHSKSTVIWSVALVVSWKGGGFQHVSLLRSWYDTWAPLYEAAWVCVCVQAKFVPRQRTTTCCVNVGTATRVCSLTAREHCLS